MRLAIVFSVLTWLVLPSVSIAQEDRVGGISGEAKRQMLQEWRDDIKLHKDKGYKVRNNEYPTTRGRPSDIFLNGYGLVSHARFYVVKLIDDKTTFLRYEGDGYILVEHDNKKLKVGDMVRLVPAVQIVESTKHDEELLPTMKLATMREYQDYVKRNQKKKR